ncbi:hypothetical protein P43SY_000380 [Pythium insidiosum]|uniref:MINDY deubiquitinase domain-containing protein n=1 Tax=Pythium insidiosum TaxID=114742 RepID=A0AAD5M6D8_PYTIN|nr:hypothetical protein P43SY_000380 [Pythium insidiosum]
MEDLYAIKRVAFLGSPVSYICQNSNGPCPLLAISNVLLLRGHISLDDKLQDGAIAAAELLEIVRQRIVAANPPLPEDRDALERLSQQKTLDDVLQLLPSLLVGLDVNVRFHSVTDFEYNVGSAVFDMLDMSLVHGWLLDQQDEATLRVVGNKSYNELIERLVDFRAVMATEAETETEAEQQGAAETTERSELPEPLAISSLRIDLPPPPSSPPSARSPSKTSPSPSKKTVETMKRERKLSDADATTAATALLEEGPVLEEFFASSASQLTYYGLVKLHEDVRERQLCVFFRNNHFATLFKFEGALYLLVTDAGYLDEPTVVWERLNEIDGDTEYFDDAFRPLNAQATRQQTLLSEQERRRALDSSEPLEDDDRTPTQSEMPSQASDEDPDFLLALRLQQEEEEARAKEMQTAAAAQRLASPARAGPTVASVTQPAPYDYDSRPPSQGDASRSESEGLVINANGEVLMSEEELKAQREAALYYQQLQQQQRQQSRSAPPSRSGTPASAGARRQSSDCSVM